MVLSIIKKYYLYIIIGVISVLTILSNLPNKVEDQNVYQPNTNNEQLIEQSYIYIDVKGYVMNPGVYKVEDGTRLFQLINLAGGLTMEADENAINLSILLKDEQAIYIPSYEDEFQLITIIEIPEETLKIDINYASIMELETLPGIGPATAQSIIDYRDENGLYQSIESIMDVTGIGESTFNEIKDFITT